MTLCNKPVTLDRLMDSHFQERTEVCCMMYVLYSSHFFFAAVLFTKVLSSVIPRVYKY